MKSLRLLRLSATFTLLLVTGSLFTQPGNTVQAQDTIRTVVGPGMTLIQYHDTSRPLHIVALEVDLRHPANRITTALAWDRLSAGNELVANMKQRKTHDGHLVIGALNGDYFGSGPYGKLADGQVINGEYVFGGTRNRSSFGMTNDGKPFVDILNFYGRIELDHGGFYPIAGMNAPQQDNRLVIYNYYTGPNTRSDNQATEWLLNPLEEIRLNRPVSFEVGQVRRHQGSMSIPQGSYVLTGTGATADSLYNELEEGDKVRVMMGTPISLSGSVTTANGQTRDVSGFNRGRGTDALILFDRHFGTSTNTNQFGTEVRLHPVDTTGFHGSSEWVVTEIEQSVGDMTIRSRERILSGHGASNDFLRDYISLGDTISLDVAVTLSKGVITEMMGGGPRLLSEGQRVSEDYVGYEGFGQNHSGERHPRSAIGYNKDSTKVWLVAIDGRQPTFSRGTTMRETAIRMRNLGAWEAVNLDGGGSTTLVVREQYINDHAGFSGFGSWRPVANAVLAVSEVAFDDIAERLKITPDEIQLDSLETIQLKADLMDTWEYPLPINRSEITWEVIDLDAEIDQQGNLTVNEYGDGYVVARYKEYADTVTLAVQEPVGLLPDHSDQPEAFALHQNYPNPFNPDTRITYELPDAVPVRLTVYDILGRPVAVLVDTEQQAGIHTAHFDARYMSSGTYIYELRAGSTVARKSMTLLK